MLVAAIELAKRAVDSIRFEVSLEFKEDLRIRIAKFSFNHLEPTIEMQLLANAKTALPFPTTTAETATSQSSKFEILTGKKS